MMPSCGVLVPEPDKCIEEKEDSIIGMDRLPPGVYGYQSSSEEENNDDGAENDVYSGYEQLPMDENPAHRSSGEEEEPVIHENLPEETNQDQSSSSRGFEVNEDLIRNAMKNVKLPPLFEPQWVKELSDDAWNNFIKTRIHTSPDKKTAQTVSTSKKT